MTNVVRPDEFLSLLDKSLKVHIKQRAEAIVEEAKQKLENAIKEEVGAIAIRLLSHYSVEQFGTELRITVKHDR